MSIKLVKKNLIIGIATAFVLLLIGVGYVTNIKANGHKKLEESCTTNKNADDCQKACEAGSAKGCFELGGLYVNGEGVKKDMTKAIQYYEKACDAGNTETCMTVGSEYYNGKIVKKDYAKAAQLFKKGCDAGSAENCAVLAMLYAEGQGVKKDLSKAKQLLKKSCDGGYELGCQGFKELK